jgi:eukaryotic-like serine/threonine-protein kinase
MTAQARWDEISFALDALLDLDGAARERELQQIDARDPTLARELRALLLADADTGLLERGVASAAPQLIADLAAGGAESASVSGRVIGRWRVLRELGRGGMGEVLLAERADEEFAQVAALKRLKRGMDSEELLSRFAQERRILATLNHPNIARLLDGGIDVDGRPFFAMEYVEGVPITDYACANALGVRERLQLMQSVCEAVAYAQGRLVVHRDLKPSNILVDARGEPRLLDFGIAKLLDDSGGPALTGTGMRVLSPAYAAPEQILGEPVSTATDVYALGVMLYELLTGQLPHRRTGAISDASAEALARETAERPSQALRREEESIVERAYGKRAPERERFAREVSGDLDRIVLGALKREPERRYPSAAAFADDLRLYLDGRPVSARPDTSGYRLRKFLRRHRVGAIATALVLLSLIAGFGVALWQAGVASHNARVAERSARHAEEQAQRAERQAQRAQQVTRFVVSLFEATNPERSVSGAEMTALDLVRHSAGRVATEMSDFPEAQGELRVTMGESLVALGDVDAGVAHVEAGVAQLREQSDVSPAVFGSALHTLAMRYEVVGRLDDAQKAVDEAFAVLERQSDPDALARISLRTTQAKLAGLRGDLSLMEAMHRQNLDERRALLGPDDARLAVDWNNIAAVALRRDHYADADKAYAEASRLLALDPQSPESRQAWVRAGRGTALSSLGRYEEARVELDAARAVAIRTLHAQHPIVGTIGVSLSSLARHRGDLASAAREAEASDAMFAAVNHPDQALAQLQLGLVYLMQQRDADALRVLTSADANFNTRRNREEGPYWLMRTALGLAQLRTGNAGGQGIIDASLLAMEQRDLVGSNVYAESLALAAFAAQWRGDTLQERSLRQRQHGRLVALLGAGHPRTRAAAAAL